MSVNTTSRPELLTVDLHDSLAVAAHRMEQAQVGALAVVAGERLVGIITERDMVRAIARETDPAGVSVAAYSSGPQTAGVQEPSRQVAQPMPDLGIRNLPVTTSDGRLIGMVSMRDLLAVEPWEEDRWKAR
jgi:CBS domain-containing protein